MKLTTLLTRPIAGLLLAFLALPAAHARPVPYNGMGGHGGAPFRVDCGESGVLVGLIGRAGVVIDRIGGLCVKVSPYFGSIVGGVYETPSHGGSGGVTFRKKCPANQVVVGITGDTKDMFGWTVVRTLNVVCRTVAQRGDEFMTRQSTGLASYWDPNIVKEDLLLCQNRGRDQGWEYSLLGLALEGSTGDYVDRLNLACGTLRADGSGIRLELQSSPANGTVSEKTPITFRWRYIIARPDLTPGLRASWELMDYKGMVNFLNGPSRFDNPCAYVKGPCQQNQTSVTFQGLPPGHYQLMLNGRSSTAGEFWVISRSADASITEKALPNRLGISPTKPDSATATSTHRSASKESAILATAPAGAASVPMLKPPQQTSPFTLKPSTGLTTTLTKPASKAQGVIEAAPVGPSPAPIDKLAPKSAF